MKWKMKRWMWAVLAVAILLVAGVVYAFVSGSGADGEVLTDTVKRGDIRQTVEATGTLESVDRVDLSFDTTGTLAVVFVGLGERVVAGQTLAELDAGELSAEYAQAVQILAQAQANLALEKAGVSEEEEAVARADVAVAQALLESARVQLAQTESVQAAAVEEAEHDLENTLVANAIAAENARQDLEDTLFSSVIAVRSALSAADEILGIDNILANDDFEIVLAVQDEQSLVDATNAYEDAVNARDRAEDAVYGLSEQPTDAELDAAADIAEEALAQTSLTLLYTRRVLDATAVDTADFSFEDLSALKDKIDAQRDAIQFEQESLVGARLARNEVDAENASREIAARDALATALAAQASAVAQAEAEVAHAEAEFARARARLAQTLAAPRGVETAALEAAVEEARARVAGAGARLANAQIVSPIDGVVTDIAFDPGEQVGAGEAALTVQSARQDLYKIVVDVPEADIAKIAMDDVADITFDAFGEDVHVAGFVKDIDPAEKVLEGVVYYEVTIYLGEEANQHPLKPGMSADVTITTDSRQQVLYVPQRAVLEHQDGSKYVRIPTPEDVFEERTVVTGLRADDGQLEIVSGLQEGETIILSIRD